MSNTGSDSFRNLVAYAAESATSITYIMNYTVGKNSTVAAAHPERVTNHRNFNDKVYAWTPAKTLLLPLGDSDGAASYASAATANASSHPSSGDGVQDREQEYLFAFVFFVVSLVLLIALIVVVVVVYFGCVRPKMKREEAFYKVLAEEAEEAQEEEAGKASRGSRRKGQDDSSSSGSSRSVNSINSSSSNRASYRGKGHPAAAAASNSRISQPVAASGQGGYNAARTPSYDNTNTNAHIVRTSSLPRVNSTGSMRNMNPMNYPDNNQPRLSRRPSNVTAPVFPMAEPNAYMAPGPQYPYVDPQSYNNLYMQPQLNPLTPQFQQQQYVGEADNQEYIPPLRSRSSRVSFKSNMEEKV